MSNEMLIVVPQLNETVIIAPSQGLEGAQGLKGDQGEQGIQGEKGDKGDTGAQGLKGDTGEKGTQGDQGIQGLKGDTGNNGKTAYQVAVINGFVGTESDWLVSLKGEKGDQGIQGVKGDTGSQGIQGTQGNQGLKGDKGDTGLQGIQGLKGDQGIQGIKGDKGDQGIQGLKGDTGSQGIQGITGADGKTAYQVAVANGFIGAESDWLLSLKGVKGDTGAQGIQGLKGDTGDQGIQGVQGIQGIQGLKGDTGSTVLPIATPTVLGGVKVGTGLSVDSAGVLTATGGGGTTQVKGTLQQINNTTTFTAPFAGVFRFYAFGAGGKSYCVAGTTANSGAGGGCAWGDVTMTAGQTATITILAGVTTVTIGGVVMFTANAGGNATVSAGGVGGTASIHASVLYGGACSGGSGMASTICAAGAPPGNPLNMTRNSDMNSSLDIDDYGNIVGGMGVIADCGFGASMTTVAGRNILTAFKDPLLQTCRASCLDFSNAFGFTSDDGAGAVISNGNNGGFMGGGAGCGLMAVNGKGGFGGSGGCHPNQVGGISGVGAGRSATIKSTVQAAGGAATCLIYY